MFKRVFLWMLLCLPAAHAEVELSKGQALYLPIYSKILHGDKFIEDKYPLDNLLSVLVSIRNTSLKTPIKIISAKYYSTEGKLLSENLPAPVIVAPMATFELYVERKEMQGGSGANFIIQWASDALTNPPIVEGVHADIKNGSRSLVFTTRAYPISLDK